MSRRFLLVLAIAVGTVLGMNAAARGQSLGDIARANREKQAAANPATGQPAVITTDDLQQGPPADSRGKDGQHAAGTAGKKMAHEPAQPDAIDPRAAAQWKNRILAEKDKLATLQARADEINALIHPAGSAQFNGPYNKYQTTQMERLASIQLQLDEQKKKLAEMQDEARRAGMHTTVYDP
jgi:hypothetical protein